MSVSSSIVLPTIDFGDALTQEKYRYRGTGFMRFPHLSLDLMNSSPESRKDKKVCIVGPSLMIFSEMYPKQTTFTAEIMAPQLTELLDVLDGGSVQLVDNDPEVIAKIERAFTEGKFCYPYGIAADAVKRADLKDVKKYDALIKKLEASMGKPSLIKTKIVSLVRDISKKGLDENKFDIVLATKVILYPALELKEGDFKRIDKLIGNLFLSLRENGVLYMDKESTDLLARKSKTTFEGLLKRIERATGYRFRSELIEHDVQAVRDLTGEPVISHVITDMEKSPDLYTFFHVIPTDHLVKFTRTK